MAAQGAPGVWAVQSTICQTEGGALTRLQKPCQAALGILPRLNAQARWRIINDACLPGTTRSVPVTKWCQATSRTP